MAKNVAKPEPDSIDVSLALKYPQCIPNEKDGTFYWRVDQWEERFSSGRILAYVKRMERIRRAVRAGQKAKIVGNSIDDSFKITSGGKSPRSPDDGLPRSARANICLSHAGTLLSGTFRECKFNHLGTPPSYKYEWQCSESIPGALVQNTDIAQRVLERIGYEPSKNSFPTGLILLAGSTKSGKSELARAIALESIRRNIVARGTAPRRGRMQLAQGSRMPHLVTFEDPIESWAIGGNSLLWRLDSPDTHFSLDHGFCFTPRQKGTDVVTLADAISDAKRQTPSCFYVGEVRRSDDWLDVLEFAGSGHLVVATTHASSLVEMIDRVLRPVRAITPSARRAVGAQLLACLHLELPELPIAKKVMLPAIWLRSGKTLSSLVADGLSSIVADDLYVWNRSKALEKLGRDNGRRGAMKKAKQHALELDIAELRRQ